MFKMPFRKVRPVEAEPQPVDVSWLDDSLELLKSTTVEVSNAAISAAAALESHLKYSEFRFFSTIDAITDLVLIKDGEGRWVTLNKLGQQVFGWSHGEYYEKTDQQLAVMYPRLKRCFDVCSKTDTIAWDLKVPSRSDEVVPNGDSEYVFDVMKTPVFNDDGSRKELIVVGRDVTKLRERERRNKACFYALNSASDAIFIIDNHERLFFCNDKFVSTFHITSYTDVVGEKITDVIDNIPEYDLMWSTVRENKTWEKTYKDGKTLTIVPMMNGAPQPIYYICTIKHQ